MKFKVGDTIKRSNEDDHPCNLRKIVKITDLDYEIEYHDKYHTALPIPWVDRGFILKYQRKSHPQTTLFK